MTASLFTIVDNNIFALLLMVFIIINIHVGKRSGSYSARFMLYMCWATIAVLTVDIIAWLFLEAQGEVGYYLIYLSNFFLFLLNPLTPVLWLMYCYIHLNDRFLSRKEVLVLCIPLYVNTLMMIASLFTDFVFSVDGANQYQRGPGVLLVALIDYTAIIAAFYYTLTHRNRVTKRFMVLVVAFSIIPIIGSATQILFYGISTAWPSMALGILLTYIFMEVQKSVRDHLTGLVNRRQFEEIVHARMTGLARSREFTLLVGDMNDFKEINDRYGHEAGDRALQEAAMLLCRSVGVSDTVARMGGDEFLILLESADESVVDLVINRVESNVERRNGESDEPYTLSVSLGYAVYDRSVHISYSDLFNEADEMMYRNKKARKGSLV